MAKKRTKAQKKKLAEKRAQTDWLVLPELSEQPNSNKQATPSVKMAKKPAFQFDTQYIRRDFRRTIISTLIVLGVLLLIFVYTRMF